MLNIILYPASFFFLLFIWITPLVKSEPHKYIRTASYLQGDGQDPKEELNLNRRMSESVNGSCVELPYPFNTQQKWILGENAMNGLSNQLFGIYSYVPVALLWNVSLVLGDVYSRDSFENAMAKYEGWNSLPFSAFFDLPHFQQSWAKRGLAAIEYSQFKTSCTAASYQTLTIERKPYFWPNKDLVMNKMLELSNIPLPVPDRSVLQFDARHPKFTAIYNYWKGGMKNKLLLLHVHRSVRPAVHIQRIVEALLAELPKQFLVAHVRLEGDFLLHEETTFETELEIAISTINTHSCLRYFARNSSVSVSKLGNKGSIVVAPAIYVASGLFNASTYRVSSNGDGSSGSSIGTGSGGSNSGSGGSSVSVQESRAAIVLQRLRGLGFKKIYTREGLLGTVISRINSALAGSSESSGNSGNSGTSPGSASSSASFYSSLSRAELTALSHSIQTLAPEQAALVDLTVSRACQCFVSSHYSSSFSYMAQRMRVMDRGQVLRYPEIGEGNFGKSGYFKQWGL